ncbi:MAG: tRNA lysidine(34) synthetase TilS [Acidobacteria bacterium]|nr:tRNA lysidine(34) synthetase TilS [Acidobacteriota bacterium]
MLDRVLRSIRRLIPAGSRVAAAVSGGPDSVALAWLLRELQRPGDYTLVAIAHFNHRLRGDEADADEAFCRNLAAELGVAFVSDRADVRAAAREWKTSVEDAARRLRYEFLERARLAQGADLMAVGHTRDDQAETFLLRLLRGAGARGLGGIHESRGAVVRPLLDLGRRELHAWLEGRGGAFRVDATNADVSIPRNRIRHQVLPLLEAMAPGASAIIARSARLSLDDEDFLAERAIEEGGRVVLSDEGSVVRLAAERLKALHPAVGRRVARGALARVAPGRFVGLKHVDALLELESGSLDLPGARAALAQGVLELTPAAGFKPDQVNDFRYLLSIPGEARVPECGLAVSAEFVIGGTGTAETDRYRVHVAAPAVTDGLAVRNRRPGDRFRPLGLGGSKKLQDYFVDRKVPRSERDRVPLVVDGRDRIVWVVGHTIAEEFSLSAGSDRGPEGHMLLLKVRHLGEPV